jgi:hypothetical protein
MTDVLGITPPNSADKTLIPVGRFEAAVQRTPSEEGDVTKARIGVDAARFGSDSGTMYTRLADKVWRDLQIAQGETDDYYHAIKPAALKLAEKGVTSLHFRIDAAYGTALIDKLRKDDELIKAFFDYKVYEVHFGGSSYSDEYYNLATEMYAEAGESLKSLSILYAPEKLEMDLCEREYNWRNKSGKDVKILEPKPDFRKRKKHSPDDGDGFVLAVAPDFLFSDAQLFAPVTGLQINMWSTG